MTIRESARIIGWPLTLFIALPINTIIHLRGVKRAMLPESYANRPEPVHEWDAVMFCDECEIDTDFILIEWREPGHTVTKECTRCGVAWEIEDEG